jgi:hypothetical protein
MRPQPTGFLAPVYELQPFFSITAVTAILGVGDLLFFLIPLSPWGNDLDSSVPK